MKRRSIYVSATVLALVIFWWCCSRTVALNEHWYAIQVNQGAAVYIYTGTSSLTLDEISKSVKELQLIRLDNMVYRDQSGAAKDFSEFAPGFYENTALINPKDINLIFPISADPRQRKGSSNNN